MTTLTLDGAWELRYGSGGDGAPETPAALLAADWPVVPASVPGNVELDLLAAGLLPDLTIGTNAWAVREIETCDWWYRRTFEAPAVPAGHRVELVCEGLDCLATLWLDGEEIGHAANMLIAHRFDVTERLRPGAPHELVIRLASPVLAARRRVVAPGEFAGAVNWESLAVRKAPHMYGWDILPRLVSAGIWRGVRLDVLPPTRWREVYATTLAADPVRGTARLRVCWDFVTDRLTLDDLSVTLTLRHAGREVHTGAHPVLGTHGRATLDLADAALWWPYGYGEPALHELTLELGAPDGEVLATSTTTIGLRTVELRRTDLTTPAGDGAFEFVVNGERIFVRGTNWVPLDSLHSRDAAHLPAVFPLLSELHCNMVRCWGGNVYEDHAFFDLCDRAGILVWQDFALACAVYPQDDDFARRLAAEAEAVVTKLRNHASLALWSGNNEGDEAYEWAGCGLDPNTDRPTREVFPAVLRRLDPHRPYLPSSPCRPPAFFAASQRAAQVLPEQHLCRIGDATLYLQFGK
jgi:beta-mannosidase